MPAFAMEEVYSGGIANMSAEIDDQRLYALRKWRRSCRRSKVCGRSPFLVTLVANALYNICLAVH